MTSACGAAAEDVSVFPSPKFSDESIGSDSATLSVSLSRANETESAAENLKSFFFFYAIRLETSQPSLSVCFFFCHEKKCLIMDLFFFSCVTE